MQVVVQLPSHFIARRQLDHPIELGNRVLRKAELRIMESDQKPQSRISRFLCDLLFERSQPHGIILRITVHGSV